MTSKNHQVVSHRVVSGADPATWKDLAVTQGGIGYLYVIQFDCDVVKVGKTADPNARMAQHISEAFAFRASPARVWFSVPHVGYDACESALIAYLTRDGESRKVRREYFHGADFDRAVDLACHAVAGTNPFANGQPFADPANVEALIAVARQKVEQVQRTAQLAASTGDIRTALALADDLREAVVEEAVNARFHVVVDEFHCQGGDYTRLGESLGLSRQRAAKLIEQARKRDIVPPPKK